MALLNVQDIKASVSAKSSLSTPVN